MQPYATFSYAAEPIDHLNSKEYEHPLDAAYLATLKMNPAFDKIIKAAFEYGIERVKTVQYTGSNIRVTEKNMPYLYNCVTYACSILDIDEIPDTYIEQNPYLNAYTIGAKHPILVLNDSLLKRMSNDEILYIIGHELGHIKSEHCQYLTVGRYLSLLISTGVSYIPYVGNLMETITSTGLGYTYYNWSRKAEMTSDRAGKLVCRDAHAAISALAKLGGYPVEYDPAFDANDFLFQAQQFDDLDDSAYNSIVKIMLTLEKDHPWAVQRAKELLLWIQDGEYARIINRCSTWMENNISKLTSEIQKAESEYTLKSAEAAVAELKVVSEPQEADRKGVKAIFAGIKSVQHKHTDSTAQKKQEKVMKAKEKIAELEMQRAALTSYYCPTSDEQIASITDGVLTGLVRMVRKKKEKHIKGAKKDDSNLLESGENTTDKENEIPVEEDSNLINTTDETET